MSARKSNPAVQYLQGDVREVLATLPDQSVHCVVTSPPYFGLRDYKLPATVWGDGCTSCLGLEPTPDLYVAHLVEIFTDVWRVLRDDGTCWLNLGDSYNNFRVEMGPGQAVHGRDNLNGKPAIKSRRRGTAGLKEKDLIGTPWHAAFALQAAGWYLRSDIVWAKGVSGQKELVEALRVAMHKAHLNADQIQHTLAHLVPYVGNCMPESVQDRPTRSHEYLFLLTKQSKYFYDSVAVRETSDWGRVNNPDWQGARAKRNKSKGAGNRNAADGGFTGWVPEAGRNRRSVWQIPTQPFKAAHFAVMPEKLAEPCILAGTSAQGVCATCGAPWRRVTTRTAMQVTPTTTGWRPTCTHDTGVVPATVLDPFGGSGTTAAVAVRLGRAAILIDLNPTYLALQKTRVTDATTVQRPARRSPVELRQQENGGQPYLGERPAVPDADAGGAAGDAGAVPDGAGLGVLPVGDDSARR